jgi:hypothetical protein
MAGSCLTVRARYGDGMTVAAMAKLLKRSETTIRRKINHETDACRQAIADPRSLVRIAIAPVVLLVGGLLCWHGGAIVSSYALFITVGHVHAAASGVGLLIAFVVLAFLFGGGKSGGSSSK